MQGLVRAVAAAGGDPIPPEMRAAMAREQGARRGRDAPASGRAKRTATGAVVIPFAADVRLAAGSGELVWNETAEMSISLARSALPAWTRPDRLRCARVVGDSMSPTIGDGDLVVVDPAARNRSTDRPSASTRTADWRSSACGTRGGVGTWRATTRPTNRGRSRRRCGWSARWRGGGRRPRDQWPCGNPPYAAKRNPAEPGTSGAMRTVRPAATRHRRTGPADETRDCPRAGWTGSGAGGPPDCRRSARPGKRPRGSGKSSRARAIKLRRSHRFQFVTPTLRSILTPRADRRDAERFRLHKGGRPSTCGPRPGGEPPAARNEDRPRKARRRAGPASRPAAPRSAGSSRAVPSPDSRSPPAAVTAAHPGSARANPVPTAVSTHLMSETPAAASRQPYTTANPSAPDRGCERAAGGGSPSETFG